MIRSRAVGVIEASGGIIPASAAAECFSTLRIAAPEVSNDG